MSRLHLIKLVPINAVLKILLDKCDQYAMNHDLVFNVKKTKCMCTKSLVMQDIYVNKFFSQLQSNNSSEKWCRNSK